MGPPGIRLLARSPISCAGIYTGARSWGLGRRGGRRELAGEHSADIVFSMGGLARGRCDKARLVRKERSAEIDWLIQNVQHGARTRCAKVLWELLPG